MITRALFICTQNLQRSPTAETIYRGRAGLEVRSAGIAPDARVPITEELLQWAEAVFVMEELHRVHLSRAFPGIVQRKRIVCLNIPDMFYYMEEDLVAILGERLEPHLGRPVSTGE